MGEAVDGEDKRSYNFVTGIVNWGKTQEMGRKKGVKDTEWCFEVQYVLDKLID